MSTSRRAFLLSSLASGAALAAASRRALADEAPRGVPRGGKEGLRLLVLGGTGFLGPQVVEQAVTRGHTVTLFNRGKTEQHTGNTFPDLESLRGDRNPDKDAGLSALEGDREWDAVIDTSGYFPRHVRASAELLAPRVRQYVFVSSISAYDGAATPRADETAPLATMEDPPATTEDETREAVGRHYGALKALCEKATQEAMDAKGKTATVVRPGFIVGPDDWSFRFPYWPLRMEQGGEVLCPNSPDDPMQVVDVRDLGAFLVKLVEDNTGGALNACGPSDEQQKVGVILEACRKAAGDKAKDATLTWVPWEFIEAAPQRVNMALYVPPKGETAGFHRWSNARAVKAGLRFRPVEETAAATLAWLHELPAEQREKVFSQLLATMPAEADLLKAWHERES